MPRPKVALISRQATVQATLKILEAEGLANFSLRRLAQELDVNQASFYHHFRGKAEILEATARVVLAEMEIPPRAGDWVEWMSSVGLSYRRLLIQRPYLIDIMLAGYRPPTGVLAFGQERLAEASIAPEFHMPILEALESLVIGSALVETRRSRGTDGAARRAQRSKSSNKARSVQERLLSISMQVLLRTLLADPKVLDADAPKRASSRSRASAQKAAARRVGTTRTRAARSRRGDQKRDR